MQPKFKVGDLVRITKVVFGSDHFKMNIGEIHPVIKVVAEGVMLSLKGETLWRNDEVELVRSSSSEPNQPQPINFILQYDLDTDPFETFSTIAEVKDRIKVLAQRSDLKRDSMKLYHVAKVEKIELSTAIAFVSEEKPVEATPEVKHRANSKQACPQCGKKFKRLQSHIVRSHKK